MSDIILPHKRPCASEASSRKQSQNIENNEENSKSMNLYIKTFEEIKHKGIKCFYEDCSKKVSFQCLDDLYFTCKTHCIFHLEEDESKSHNMKKINTDYHGDRREKLVNYIKSYNSDLKSLKQIIASKVTDHFKTINQEIGVLFMNIDATVTKNKHKILDLTSESQIIFENITLLDQFYVPNFPIKSTKESHKIEMSDLITEIIKAEIIGWNKPNIAKENINIQTVKCKLDPKLIENSKKSSEISKNLREKSDKPLLHWCEWKTNKVHYFDFTENTEKSATIENLYIPKYSTSVSVNHNSILLCGGRSNDDIKTVRNWSCVFLINLETQSFKKLSPMNEGRYDFCMTYMNGFYYVLGGDDYKGKCLIKCEKYSIEHNIWQNIGNLALPRRLGACVTISKQNCIYIMGGFESASEWFNKTVEKYDAVQNEWKFMWFKKSILGCLLGAISLPDLDLVFIFGGLHLDEECQKECYFVNYETNHVTYTNPMSSKSKLMRNIPVFYDDKVYCYSWRSNSERELSIYDIESRVWSIKS